MGDIYFFETLRGLSQKAANYTSGNLFHLFKKKVVTFGRKLCKNTNN